MSSTQAFADTEKEVNTCDVLESLARKVMTIRQNKSLPLKKALSVMKTKSSRFITIMAWEKPSFSGDKMQKKAISEFADSVYLSCLKSSKG